MNAVTTAKLRAAIKSIDREARVAPSGPGSWTVRTQDKLDEVRSVLSRLGLVEVNFEIEGSRWDPSHVLYVLEDDAKTTAPTGHAKKKKTGRQLDAEIAHAIASRSKKPSASVVALFAELADRAEVSGMENLSYARREEGYTGDPKEFRFSDIWARRLPDYQNSLLVDYINEAYETPHERLGRKLTDKEASWMQREASKLLDAERRYVESNIRERDR